MQGCTKRESDKLPRSSARPSEARPHRAKRGRSVKRGRCRKAPGSRRRPPSLARASNKSWDATQLAATEHVAYKLSRVGGHGRSTHGSQQKTKKVQQNVIPMYKHRRPLEKKREQYAARQQRNHKAKENATTSHCTTTAKL